MARDEDEWIFTAGGWVRRSNPSGKRPKSPVIKGEQQNGGRKTPTKRPAIGPPQVQNLNDREKLGILRREGYNLPLGWGPKAQRAWANYQLARAKGLDTKKAGAYWTANQPRPAGPGGVTSTGAPGAAAGGGGGGGGGSTRSTQASKGSGNDLIARFESMIAQALDNLINPSSYASQAAGAEYDPQIAALDREIGRQPKQAAMNISNITDWYNQVMGTARTGAGLNKQMAAGAVGASGAATQGVINALGGSASAAAGDVGEWGNMMTQTLNADAASGAAFDQRLQTLFQGEGASAKTSEQNYQKRLAQELLAGRKDLVKAKGQKYGALMSEATNQRIQQMAGIQNMLLGVATLPYEIDSKRLAVDLQKGQLAAQDREADLDEMQLQYAREQIANSGKTQFKDMEPDERLKLSQYLTGSVVSRGKNGLPHARPQTLYNRFIAEMSAAGLNPSDPEVRGFVVSVLRRLFPNTQQFPFSFLQ